MNKSILIEQKAGNELSQEELEIINEWRVKEFKSIVIWGPDTINSFGDNIIFILKRQLSNEILAFARLKPLSLWINEIEFPVWGLGGVVTIERGKGHGLELLQEIEAFIDTFHGLNRSNLVGFCNSSVSKFYKKAGMGILQKGSKQFKYINEANQKMTEEINDILFYPKSNLLLEKIKANKFSEVLHYTPRW